MLCAASGIFLTLAFIERVAVALLMGEICSDCSLWDIVGPSSSLSDEGLEDLLEGFDRVVSRVVLRVSAHDVVHGVC
jgi:hypothetical protein